VRSTLSASTNITCAELRIVSPTAAFPSRELPRVLHERGRQHRTGTDQKSTSRLQHKKSSKAMHASGGLATYCCPRGPHRRATVAGLGLVGGTVRSSQDANLLISHPQPMSTVALRLLGHRVAWCPEVDVRFALKATRHSAPSGVPLANGSIYLSSQTSSMRQLLKMLSTMIVRPLTYGRSQVPPRR
jgi:hypothetical protein